MPAFVGPLIGAGARGVMIPIVAVGILLLVDVLLLLVMVVVPFSCAFKRLDSPAAVSACFLELTKRRGVVRADR